MGVVYPEAWAELVDPQVRAELIEYLKNAAVDDAYQRPAEVEFLMHFVFDDHGEQFWPEPRASIGQVLFDDGEADALKSFAIAFHKALGTRSKKLSRITSAEWIEVSCAAVAALRTLASRGLPTYTES